MSPEDMTEVVRFAAERGIWVISDECYVYLNYTGREFSVGTLQEYRERMVVVGSLSKTYAMTGWRMGYALAPAPVIAAMQKLQSQSTSNPTSIVQKAAVAALIGSQDCVAEMRKEYIQLREHVLARLSAIKGLRCARPEGAFYVYAEAVLHFSAGRDCTRRPNFHESLLHDAHVATVPGEGFGTNEHVRISYATSQKELDRGLERLREARRIALNATT